MGQKRSTKEVQTAEQYNLVGKHIQHSGEQCVWEVVSESSSGYVYGLSLRDTASNKVVFQQFTDPVEALTYVWKYEVKPPVEGQVKLPAKDDLSVEE